MFKNSQLLEKARKLKCVEAKKWIEMVEKVCETFKHELESIRTLFNEYTDHGIKHCESVIDTLEKLVIGRENLRKAKWKDDRLMLSDRCYLTLEEIILLFLGALLHDIGM